MKRAVSFTYNTLIVFFLGLLANAFFINVSFAQCSTSAAPAFTGSCSTEFFASITASGPYVTSTINITNTSCTGTYLNDFSSQGVLAPLGGTVNLNISRVAGSIYTGYLSVYVDWNNDGTYETTELAGTQYTFAPLAASTVYSFIVPTTGVVTGTNLHMRIYLVEGIGVAPCTGSYGQAVEVYLNADCTAPTITATPSTGSYCAGGQGATITASGAGTGAVVYTWAPAAGLSASTGAAVIATPAATTVYTVTGTSALGCSNTATSTVTVYSVTPTISSAGAVESSLCAGSALHLDAAITPSASPYTYTWTGPGGYTHTTTTFAFTNSVTVTAVPALPANPVYTITVSDAHHCMVTSTATTTVDPLPTAYNVYGDGIYCVGTAGVDVQLASSDLGVNYQLYSGGAAVGGIITGTGGALDFGDHLAGSYSVTGVYSVTGCSVGMAGTATIGAVSPPPAITGSMTVCAGLTTLLSDATTGGVWSISGSSIATVSAGGVVSGVAAGNAIVTYTSGGCSTSTIVTVYPLAPITGGSGPCAGSSEILGDLASGGAWSSSSPGIAGITAGGLLTAIMAGNTTITYLMPTGCMATLPVTVNPLPPAITGTVAICPLSSGTLSDPSPMGTWSSSNIGIAVVGSGTGVVIGIGPGTATITYTLPTGCITTAPATVFTPPPAILQFSGLCLGYTAALSDAVAGGTWSSSAPGTASVGSAGVVSGIAIGTATITYTAPVTGCMTAHIVTVEPLPAAITGPLTICQGPSVTLSDATPGGTWTCSTPSIATVNPATGVVTGVAQGIATITYTISTGCIQTAGVTVNPLPLPIAGNDNVCVGSTTSLFNSSDGVGTWSSSAPGIASIGSSSGVVSGIAAGTAVITFTLSTGCFITMPVTVNPLPTAVSGNTPVCTGSSITLSGIPVGGTWSSASTAVATVGSSSGSVAGVSAGTVVITYTLPTGCALTTVVTVNPSPAGISGATNICLGLTSSLSDATTGGAWSSSFAFVASVGSTGIVTGNAIGTATITYALPTGCLAAATIAVYPLPSPITGTLRVCAGSTTSLSDAGGGTWNSGATAIASIAAGAGIVTGNAAGTATITYTLPTGCATSAIVTVNPLPLAISGITNVCTGLTVTLSDASPGGSWSSGNPAVATIGSGTGLVTGVFAGNAPITYTLATGCISTTVVTVQPLPSAINGVTHVCVGLTTSLTDVISGGTWSSGSPGVASVGATGIVTGATPGTAGITYTVAGGCISFTVVTVNPLPAAISGIAGICAGSTTTLSDASPGGTWYSSNTFVASIGTGGFVTTVSAGVSGITYTLPTGCLSTLNITVNPLPLAISGPMQLCVGADVSLSDASTGGLWSIDPAASGIAAVFPSSGDVSGLGAGTAIVTYTLPTGCITTSVITVDPLPATITGSTSICVGAGTTLSDASTGGTWSSSNAAQATITAGGGTVSGISQGILVITYQLPTGCLTTIAFTVNPLPGVIAGSRSICLGATSALSDASTGGTWSLHPVLRDSIGLVSGIVTADSAGIATVTYTLPTGCLATTTITVNPLPSAILADTFPICQGFDITLSDSTPGGTWSSANAGIATVIASTGVVAGVSAGTVNISYTLSTGCGVAAVVTVNPLFPIAGSRDICLGVPGNLSDLATGGVWSTGSPSVATINSATGAVIGVTSGSTYISYHLSTGCIATTIITVNPLPASYNVTGGGGYCAGGTGVDIGLNGSQDGVSYQLIYSGSAVDTLPGSGSALDFGLFTFAGAYTVLATDSITGCSNTMTGSAMVTVNPTVTPFVSIGASGGTTICVGTIADFTATAINGGSAPLYEWSVNGIGVGSGPGYSYVPLSGDVVSVELISNAPCAIPDSAAASVTMTTVNGIMPSVSLSVSPGDSVCPGTPVTVTPSTSTGGTSPTFEWIKNGINVASGLTYTFLPIDGDNVFCWMHSDLTCALADTVHSDNNINMRVPPIYVPDVTIATYPGTRIESGELVTLVASVTFSGLSFSYQWEINNTPVAGATTDTFRSSSFNNMDVVSCVVTGASICGVASRSAQVLIVDTIATGVQEVQPFIADIRLIPNPNNGTFTVSGTAQQSDEIKLLITDMLGQIVYSENARVFNGKINEQVQLNGMLANGMYTLELRSGTINKIIHFVVGQ